MQRTSAIRLFSSITIASVILAASSFVSAAPIVIANNDVGATTIKAKTLKKLFLGKSTKHDNGTPVNFVVLQDSDTHSAFLDERVSKTPSQFLSYWRKLAFSGQGQLPKELPSEEALVGYVASTPGAIGYVDEATATDGVSVLTVE